MAPDQPGLEKEKKEMSGKKKTSTAASKKKAAPKKTAARKPATKKPAARKPAANKPKTFPVPAVKKTPAAQQPAPAKPAFSRYEIQRRVRVAAYYKYVKRDRKHGAHLHDWKEAEKDILSQF
jgi:hypothetical protein